MKKESKLEILDINRKDLQRNMDFALETLAELNQSNQSETDADVQLSLQLNNSLARFHFDADYEGSVAISVSAIEKFAATGNPYFVIMHLSVIGGAYTVLKNYTEADVYYNKAISLGETNPSFALLLVNIYQQKTANSTNRGELDAAIDYSHKSLELLLKYPHQVLKNRVLLQLGNVCCEQGNYKAAMEYLNRALEGFESEMELLLMSVTYISMGKCSLMSKELSLAKKYLLKGLELGNKTGQPENCALNNLYLAQVFQQENNMEEAYTYAAIAQKIAKGYGDNVLMAEADKILLSATDAAIA